MVLGKDVLNLNFDGSATLAKRGWSVHQPKNAKTGSDYRIANKRLEIIAKSAKNLQGGYIELDIPLIRKGIFEFDLKDDHHLKGIGLFIDFYNISLFWHDYCRDWRRYFPEPTSNRLKAYDVEPVGHRRLGKVERKKWSHYKIYFDTDNDVVEYYKDDMENPVYIDGAAPVLGRQEYLGGKLRIGNWGVCKAPMKFLIDNIRISTIDDAASEDKPRDRYLLFKGLAFQRYDIGGALRSNGVPKDRISEFTIENPKPALTPENKFFIDRLPGSESMNRAKSCVFIDCPFGPHSIIPEVTQKAIIANVRSGMRLVVFGGLYAFGKGYYEQAYLSEFLPVEIKGPWEVKKLSLPLLVTPVSGAFGKMDWKNPPAVEYIHDLKLKKGAEILLKAGEKPLLVRSKLGKGEILIFLGAPCGVSPRKSRNPLFWKWNQWRKLVSEIVK
jgi:hypothetical protein